MPKGQATLGPAEFVAGWVKGVKEGKTVTEIADSLGMKYGACLARVRSLQNMGIALPDAVRAPKGKQIGKELMDRLKELVRQANIEDGLLDPEKEPE